MELCAFALFHFHFKLLPVTDRRGFFLNIQHDNLGTTVELLINNE